MNPFKFVTAISETKEDILVDPDLERHYDPFLVNRSLSYHRDTVQLANEMNMAWHLPRKMQFDFLRKMVRQRKRYAKWHKAEIHDEIEAIKTYYNVSDAKAEDIMGLLDSDQIQTIVEKVSNHGKARL
jgi:hypothetical protein